MTTSPARPFCALRWLPLVLVLLLSAGCAGERRSMQGPPSADAGAVPPARTPDMEAHGTFFAGQIEVESVLNAAGFGARGGKGGAGDAGGAPSAASSGGGRRAGGFSGGLGGGRRQRGGGGEDRSAETDSDGPAPQIHASNAPPVRLHLRLTNHGPDPVEVEVVDFNSDLGNFVVQPSKFTLPPGGSAEAEPMISRLGVSTEEIPLTVNLRTAGHGESQVLMLRVVPPPAPPPAGPP